MSVNYVNMSDNEQPPSGAEAHQVQPSADQLIQMVNNLSTNNEHLMVEMSKLNGQIGEMNTQLSMQSQLLLNATERADKAEAELKAVSLAKKKKRDLKKVKVSIEHRNIYDNLPDNDDGGSTSASCYTTDGETSLKRSRRTLQQENRIRRKSPGANAGKDIEGNKTDRRTAQSVTVGRVKADLTSSPAQNTGAIPKTRAADVMSIDSDATIASNSEDEGAVGGQPLVNAPKHSPPFLVKEMSTPAFIKAMKEANVNTVTRILASGQQRIQCKYEDRRKVREWLETNKVEGQTNTCNNERLGVAIAKGIHIDYTEGTFVKKWKRLLTFH